MRVTHGYLRRRGIPNHDIETTVIRIIRIETFIENVDIGGETPLFKVTSINQSMIIKSLVTEVNVALRPQISGRRK